MKKFALYSVVTATMLAFAPAVMADTPPATAPANTIAVVNIQKIMHDSTAYQNVSEQMEAKQKAFQSDISKKQAELQEEDQELGKKRSVLSKKAFEEKATKFRAKATEVQKEVQSKKALLDNAFEHALADIQKAVTDIISDMSKEKGFVLAIPTSQILYADSKLDISSEVLTRLNQKLTKLDVKFDAAPDAKLDKKADKAPDAKSDAKSDKQ